MLRSLGKSVQQACNGMKLDLVHHITSSQVVVEGSNVSSFVWAICSCNDLGFTTVYECQRMPSRSLDPEVFCLWV